MAWTHLYRVLTVINIQWGGGAVSGTFNWVVILEKGIAPLSQTQIFSNLQPDDLNL